MDLFTILKQFKNIEPDPAYTATSKRAILAMDPSRPSLRVVPTLRTVFFKVVETGAAVALTGFFVLLLTGALSNTGLTPQYSAVNPEALRAEAQAIDIQIQLSKLNYTVPSGESASTLLQMVTTTPSGALTTTVSVAAASSSSATSAATTTVTIDQALQGLTK